MKRSSVVRLCAAGAAMMLAAPATLAVEPAPLLGFTAARAEQHRAREAAFDAAIRAGEMQAWMRRLAGACWRSCVGVRSHDFISSMMAVRMG